MSHLRATPSAVLTLWPSELVSLIGRNGVGSPKLLSIFASAKRIQSASAGI